MKRAQQLCVVLVLGCLSGSLLGWETDLHYGLTKWLAFQAGFNLQDAEIIARGTQEPDEGKLYPAPSAVFEAACLGHRNEDLSRLVQNYHFPSYGALPGSPPARSVAPDSAAAMALAEKEIQTILPSEPRERTLEHLGVALHPLQDSWSHQGEPGIPWTCWKDLAYGHPATRGGWRKHDADLTYLHEIPDTFETAHRTYDALVAFLAKHPSMRSHPAISWSKLQPHVVEFAKASSKKEKAEWFKGQKDVPLSSYTSYPDFLRYIDLPDSASSARSSLTPQLWNVREIQEKSQPIEPPKEAQELVDRFLNIWIVQHSPERALELASVDEVAKPFTIGNPAVSSQVVARSVLGMWLVRDHGLVNLLGHGVGNMHELTGFEKLPQIEAGSLRNAIFGTRDRVYDMVPLELEKGAAKEQAESYGVIFQDSYAVVFQFRHAPRDAVVLIVHRDARKGWFVSRLMWWIL